MLYPAIASNIPAARQCQRLGEIQARLMGVGCPTERSTLQAEVAQVLSALETANVRATLLCQPHV